MTVKSRKNRKSCDNSRPDGVNCTPLFTPEEMRTIFALAVKAGMENDPQTAGLLDGIIHKAELTMGTEEPEPFQEQAAEYDRTE